MTNAIRTSFNASIISWRHGIQAPNPSLSLLVGGIRTHAEVMPTPTNRRDDLYDLEFMNDTITPVVVHLLRTDRTRAGSGIALHAGENITLVLESASRYNYAVERRGHAQTRTVEISIHIWCNATCRISEIFRSASSHCGCPQYIQLAEGIKVMTTQTSQGDQSHRGSTDPCHDTGWAIQAGHG
ncbi:hypothetical protein C8Q80DRAFT_1129662 [Daedaleopsis nitida]|nr:hypothetical protein C8Q80DRAFT_1129662 [Daedaleopsis nitida]